MKAIEKIHMACYETAQYLLLKSASSEPLEMIYGGAPELRDPALLWRMKRVFEPGFSLFSLADRLPGQAAASAPTCCPPTAKELPCKGFFVAFIGVSRDLANHAPRRTSAKHWNFRTPP